MRILRCMYPIVILMLAFTMGTIAEAQVEPETPTTPPSWNWLQTEQLLDFTIRVPKALLPAAIWSELRPRAETAEPDTRNNLSA